MKRYWLTPPELDHEKEGKFDPCPYPRPDGWDALTMAWEKPWYLNPPFNQATRFVRKALSVGGPGVMVLPCTGPIYLLVEQRIPLEAIGRPRWREVKTGEPQPDPVLCVLARLD